MLMGVWESLDAIVHCVKNNAPEDEFKAIRRLIGASMGETILISNRCTNSIQISYQMN